MEDAKERVMKFRELSDGELNHLLAELMESRKATEIGKRLDVITVALMRVLART